MPFCKYCNSKINEGANFCAKCGKAQNNTAIEVKRSVQDIQTPPAAYYGTETHFTFMGRDIIIPAEMDVLNHYRLIFRSLARVASGRLNSVYIKRITHLDAFLTRFDSIYIANRTPVLEYAVNVLTQMNIYDVTFDSLSQRHTENYCLVREDFQNALDSFNMTLENNRDRKARNAGMLPGMIFGGGILGFAGALAYNVGTTAIAESSIRNAKVSASQRDQIFRRIKRENLMNRVYLDYWRVFLTMCDVMREHGFPVWGGSDSDAEKTKNIAENMSAGRIPMERIPDLFVNAIETFPYNSQLFVYMNHVFGGSEELQKLNRYFGFNGIEV